MSREQLDLIRGTAIGAEWLVLLDNGEDPAATMSRRALDLGPVGIAAVHAVWLQVIDVCRDDRSVDVLVAGPPITALGSPALVETIRIVDQYRSAGAAAALAHWLELDDVDMVAAVSTELAAMAARLARAHYGVPLTRLIVDGLLARAGL